MVPETVGIAAILKTTLQISTADHAVRPLLHLRETAA